MRAFLYVTTPPRSRCLIRCQFFPPKPTRALSSTTLANSVETRSFPTQSTASYSDLLPLCSAAKSLRQAHQLHAFAVANGFLPRSVSLSASLILCHARFGAFAVSRRLFEETSGFCKTAFLWNTLVRACYVSGVRDGFWVYNRMVRTGFVLPDGHTFPFVLKLCSDFGEARKGSEVHGCVFKLGFDRDVFVGNTLMAFYGTCGDFSGARRVFVEMPMRDVVSWNTVIRLFSVYEFYEEAVGCFREMSLSSLKPNSVSIVSVLPACACLGDEVMASKIHTYIVKVGLDLHLIIGNALIDVYGKCGNVKASKKIFDAMICKNDVSWNSAITSLTYIGRITDALVIFRSMIESGFIPNSITISSIIPVLVELGHFRAAKELHGFSMRMGIDSDVFISNSLIDMYSKAGCSKLASDVFENMARKNTASWNAMVANFAQNRLESAALELVRQMQAHGETPNGITFTNVLPGCARLGFLRPGKEIHSRAIRVGSASDLFVSNALIDMYAKCGCLVTARNVFNISKRDEVSYNTLIVGYSQTSDCSESLSLFSEMRFSGIRYDAISFVGVISACANLSTVKNGKEVHASLMRKYSRVHLFVSNSLVDFYIKCGRIDLARNVFDHIPNKDVTSWNSMIMGYGMLGNVEAAIDLFEAMSEDKIEYDSVSYVAVLSACSHGGLVEKGKKFFNQMKAKHIEPKQMHYACMVDLLGRAGLMEEVWKLIRGLPISPDANVWGALLGACRIHGNVELGALAAENLFRLRPRHSGYYILLSNMYAEAGRWNEANRVRELMKSRGVKKDPGCSWVQFGNRVHAFGVGDSVDLDSGTWNTYSL